MAVVDLSLYQVVFGGNTAAFSGTMPDLPLRKETGDLGSPYFAKDALGREYYLPVKVFYGEGPKNGVIDNGIAAGITGSSGQAITTGIPTFPSPTQKELMLPHPIMSISAEKNVVETPMTDRIGSVIELTGFKNFEISIRGIMVSATKELPEDQMKLLQAVFMAGNSVKIRSVISDIYLGDVGFMCVVKSFKLPEMRGIKGVRLYELQLVSDSIFDLYEI